MTTERYLTISQLPTDVWFTDIARRAIDLAMVHGCPAEFTFKGVPVRRFAGEDPFDVLHRHEACRDALARLR